jgi:hypothetical protein
MFFLLFQILFQSWLFVSAQVLLLFSVLSNTSIITHGELLWQQILSQPPRPICKRCRFMAVDCVTEFGQTATIP